MMIMQIRFLSLLFSHANYSMLLTHTHVYDLLMSIYVL